MRKTPCLPPFLPAIALCAMLVAALAGCVAPVPLQVASWVADGISYAATEKSITDHGLSAITGEDCAIWRVARDEEVCHAPTRDTAHVAMEPDLAVH